MFRDHLILTAGLLVSSLTWAQGVYQYPKNAEISDTLKESSEVLNRFDEVTGHLDIDNWRAPKVFLGRQKLLLQDAQEHLDDVRDTIETELETISSGKHASTTDILFICTKMNQIVQFVENVYVYSSAFHENAPYSEMVALSELAGSAKSASIHCSGILTVQVEADEIRVQSCRRISRGHPLPNPAR